MVSLEQMHEKLKSELAAEHRRIDMFCPKCGGKLAYLYLEERLYSVKCPECGGIDGLTYGASPLDACRRVGAVTKHR